MCEFLDRSDRASDALGARPRHQDDECQDQGEASDYNKHDHGRDEGAVRDDLVLVLLREVFFVQYHEDQVKLNLGPVWVAVGVCGHIWRHRLGVKVVLLAIDREVLDLRHKNAVIQHLEDVLSEVAPHIRVDWVVVGWRLDRVVLAVAETGVYPERKVLHVFVQGLYQFLEHVHGEDALDAALEDGLIVGVEGAVEGYYGQVW